MTMSTRTDKTGATTPADVPGVLCTARVLIEQWGWSQRASVHRDTGAVDIETAVRIAAGADERIARPTPWGTAWELAHGMRLPGEVMSATDPYWRRLPSERLAERALAAIDRVLVDGYGIAPVPAWVDQWLEDSHDHNHFNDRADTTADRVIRLLDLAVEREV